MENNNKNNTNNINEVSMNTNGYGVITEQGDLGLGFAGLNESDSSIYKEAEKNRK